MTSRQRKPTYYSGRYQYQTFPTASSSVIHNRWQFRYRFPLAREEAFSPDRPLAFIRGRKKNSFSSEAHHTYFFFNFIKTTFEKNMALFNLLLLKYFCLDEENKESNRKINVDIGILCKIGCEEI